MPGTAAGEQWGPGGGGREPGPEPPTRAWGCGRGGGGRGARRAEDSGKRGGRWRGRGAWGFWEEGSAGAGDQRCQRSPGGAWQCWKEPGPRGPGQGRMPRLCISSGTGVAAPGEQKSGAKRCGGAGPGGRIPAASMSGSPWAVPHISREAAPHSLPLQWGHREVSGWRAWRLGSQRLGLPRSSHVHALCRPCH